MSLVRAAEVSVTREGGQRSEHCVPVLEEAIVGHRLIVLLFTAVVNRIVAIK